jgi:hypothetical protein
LQPQAQQQSSLRQLRAAAFVCTCVQLAGQLVWLVWCCTNSPTWGPRVCQSSKPRQLAWPSNSASGLCQLPARSSYYTWGYVHFCQYNMTCQPTSTNETTLTAVNGVNDATAIRCACFGLFMDEFTLRASCMCPLHTVAGRMECAYT